MGGGVRPAPAGPPSLRGQMLSAQDVFSAASEFLSNMAVATARDLLQNRFMAYKWFLGNIMATGVARDILVNLLKMRSQPINTTIGLRKVYLHGV